MIVELVGGAIALAVILFLLRELGVRCAAVISALSMLLILFRSVGRYGDALGALMPMIDGIVADGALADMLKVTGMTYLFGISSDACAELGAQGVARALDAVGRVEIMLVALPYVKEIIELGAELI